MTKIAVIKTGGKQYKVKEKDIVKIEKIDQEIGSKISFETLLSASTDGNELDLGTPKAKGKVEGKVLEQGKDKKVSVVKYKNKTRYLRNKGHRQTFTKVEIGAIA